MQRVERILERVTELPFSPVAGKILELARDERIGAREIARIITQDQAFTARLLKIANSPYYGQTRAVTTVTQAVPVLAIDTISSLATALASFTYASNDDGALLTMRELWEHSVGCAIWGRQLARQIGHRGAEEMFIAGLLHDLGKSIFYRFFKNEFLAAVAVAEAERIPLADAERRFFDTDHAEAGATVAAKWNLPPALIQTIRFHHCPLSVPEDMDPVTRKTVALIHVADALSDHFQIGRGLEPEIRSVSAEFWEYLSLDMGMCQDLLGTVLGEVSEFRKICDLYSAGKKLSPARPTPPVDSATPLAASRQSPRSRPAEWRPLALRLRWRRAQRQSFDRRRKAIGVVGRHRRFVSEDHRARDGAARYRRGLRHAAPWQRSRGGRRGRLGATRRQAFSN